MLWMIFVALLALWFQGWLNQVAGGMIHLLLIAAAAVILINILLSGRRSVLQASTFDPRQFLVVPAIGLLAGFLRLTAGTVVLSYAPPCSFEIIHFWLLAVYRIGLPSGCPLTGRKKRKVKSVFLRT